VVSKTINDLEVQLVNQRTKIGLTSNILDLAGSQEAKVCYIYENDFIYMYTFIYLFNKIKKSLIFCIA
jgi:hypothetical protein